jgi:hypothetical protein
MPNLTVARKFRDDIDADFGYPLPNVVCPGGVSAPIGQTTGYATLLKHPTLNQWAYGDEPVVRGKRGHVPIPGGGSQLDLDTDSSWDGALPASFVQTQLE